MDKALGYLALAAKAGKLRIGELDIKTSVQRGKGSLLVLAQDAGQNTALRAQKLTELHPMALVKTAYTKSEIAAAIGRSNPVALVLVRDDGLARAFAEAARKES
ncbi:MAG: ribosomal L7Ae/L30e/S12e/Gadd45 family protein [Oscillospiraceae bacterium]|nr:ribosomal L7Ae/L30e/S12e/Gadd45 family protein [Oscillospiraceae bacterium]